MNGFVAKSLKLLGWLVLAVALLMALAWWALPSVLKSQAEQRLGALLGRTVSIGQVEFKPWSLELTVRQIQIAGLTASATPLLKVERLHANADARSLFRMAPVLQAFELDAPHVHLTRTGEGRYDFDDVLARLQAKSAPETSAEPARFALYNMQLKSGSVTLDDRALAGRMHELRDLQITLPFLSNLPAELSVKVEPRLAFMLNGAAFDSGAQATPFAQNRASDLRLSFKDIDLSSYLAYVPASVPVRLKRGVVSLDAAVKFAMAEGAQAQVSVQGNVSAKNVEVQDPNDAPLLDWSALTVVLKDVQPLKRSLLFGEVVLDGLQVSATRDAKGRVNLLQWSQAKPGPAAKPAAAAAAVSSTPAWAVQLDSFKLLNAQVHWSDAQTRPAVAYALNDVSLKTGPLAWPVKSDAEVQISATLMQAGKLEKSSAAQIGSATLTAVGSDKKAQVKLQLAALSLQALRPYLAPHLLPQLSGTLAAQAQLDWAGGLEAQADQIKVALPQVVLDSLRLDEVRVARAPGGLAVTKTALASLLKFEAADVQLDLNAKSVSVAAVKLTQPQISLARDALGVWNVQQWTESQPSKAPSESTPRTTTQPVGPATPSWRVQLRDLALSGGRMRFSDAQPRPRALANAVGSAAAAAGQELAAVPVQFELSGVKLALQNFSLQDGKTKVPAKLALSASLTPLGGATAAASTGGNANDARRAGALEWTGQIGMQPLLASGKLRVNRFPVQTFEPYFGDALNVSLLRAEAGYQGDVLFREESTANGKTKGMRISLAGDALLADLLVHTKPTAETRAGRSSTDELLSWQALTLKGLKLDAAPGAAPQIEIQEAALSDFYSRLVITEEGRFNLQDAAAPVSAEATAATAFSTLAPITPPSPSPSPLPAPPPAPAPSAASAPGPEQPPAFNLLIRSTRLNNGKVDFTDRFIRPNYSANLTELNGGLGEFRTGTRDMATLELRGKAAGTALLDIKGQINPTAKPLALDIRAKATDLELAPFSPYAGKYAGYAIERGKLSVDVSYKIDAAGNLDAKNQVTLNQLTFGDKIESASATKLPVLLAVALLKDRNGVIDINLPVSGSLDNPQFSVFGIVLKVIGNLLVKAFTSPFALLGGGGGEDLSLVGFKPGTATATEEGRATLGKVAKALSEKPSLKMTVTGAADPASEREAFVQTLLEQRLLAERKRELVRAGAAPEAAVVMAAEDRARALKEIYKQTEIPGKPRNAIGIARDIAGPEMEALLKTRIVVSADAMRELALQRGLAVRDALIAQGLPSERLFLAAPKLRASGEDDAAWSPRVQLALTVN